MNPKSLKPHQRALVAAVLASVVLGLVPLLHWVLLPLQYLNTHIHELAHALAALAVGGRASHIAVFADGSGLTPIQAPRTIFATVTVASAGYVGAALAGAAMIYFGRSAVGARKVLWTVAAVLALSMVLWVRADVIGILSGLFWVGALAVAGRNLKGEGAVFAAQFLGLQQCFNAAQSGLALLQVSAFTERQSDARLMERASGIPAIAWATLWCLIGLAMVVLTLRRAWSTSARP